MTPETTAQCQSCGAERPLRETTAYWPLADPSDIRYVCRPGTGNVPQPKGYMATCFRIVGRASEYGIAAAEGLTQGGPNR